jgi:hypothetical protein
LWQEEKASIPELSGRAVLFNTPGMGFGIKKAPLVAGLRISHV